MQSILIIFIKILVVISMVIGLIVYWHRFDLPTSMWEIRVSDSLHREVVRNSTEIALERIAPGNWEIVCDSHGYGGDFYFERYKRTYKPVGRASDDAWGLLFINSAGSFNGARGSCSSPGLSIAGTGCVNRRDAILVRKSLGDCPAFELRARPNNSFKPSMLRGLVVRFTLR